MKKIKREPEMPGDTIWDVICSTMKDLPVCCCKLGGATEIVPFSGRFCPAQFARRLRGIGWRIKQAYCRVHDKYDGDHVYSIEDPECDIDVATLSAMGLQIEFEIISVGKCEPEGQLTTAMSNLAEMTDAQRLCYGFQPGWGKQEVRESAACEKNPAAQAGNLISRIATIIRHLQVNVPDDVDREAEIEALEYASDIVRQMTCADLLEQNQPYLLQVDNWLGQLFQDQNRRIGLADLGVVVNVLQQLLSYAEEGN